MCSIRSVSSPSPERTLRVKVDEDLPRSLAELLRGVLDATTLEELKGQVAVVTPRGLRVAART